jgi:hypothetical protein
MPSQQFILAIFIQLATLKLGVSQGVEQSQKSCSNAMIVDITTPSYLDDQVTRSAKSQHYDEHNFYISLYSRQNHSRIHTMNPIQCHRLYTRLLVL